MDALLLRGSWSPPAAAPLLRASCSPPAAVAVSSNTRARPVHRIMHVDPGRRDTYLQAPVKVQARARGAFRYNCSKGADRHPDPNLKREDVDEPDSAESSEYSGIPLLEQLRKNREAFNAAMGVRETPDMFIKEKDQITKYKMNMYSSSSDDKRATALAQDVCSEAQTALDIASKIIDIARVGLGTKEISEHTINQMVRTCTTTFLSVAEDAYHKRVHMEAIISFVGALRGLGEICHILVQSTVDKLKDGPLKDSITRSMDYHTQVFDKEVNKLKDKLMAATIINVHKRVTDVLFDGTLNTSLYISQLVDYRRAALPHIKVL